MTEKEIVDSFISLYWNNGIQQAGTWLNTYWLGVQVQKFPTDLWNYQELIYELRPDLIVETGTLFGGSALFLACACDMVGHGKVMTIDNADLEDIYRNNPAPRPAFLGRVGRPEHERITYLCGSSTAAEIVDQVKCSVGPEDVVMAILDSDHKKDHVLEEMRIYGDLVTKGSYMVVEDTIINNPVLPEYGPGPMEAVQEFLEENADFMIDNDKEKFYLTSNPNGYLKKTR